MLDGKIMLEIRYRAMARLAEESGDTLVDLTCGYTPGAIEFAKKGHPSQTPLGLVNGLPREAMLPGAVLFPALPQ